MNKCDCLWLNMIQPLRMQVASQYRELIQSMTRCRDQLTDSLAAEPGPRRQDDAWKARLLEADADHLCMVRQPSTTFEDADNSLLLFFQKASSTKNNKHNEILKNAE